MSDLDNTRSNTQEKTTAKDSSLIDLKQKCLIIFQYSVLLVIISTFIIQAIIDWKSMYSLFRYIFRILSPFLLGFVFAFILNPMVNWFINKVYKKLFHVKKDRTALYLSLFTTYFIIIGCTIILLIVVIPQIYTSLIELTNNISIQYFVTMDKLSNAPSQWHNINVDSIMSLINSAIPQIVTYISNITTNLIPFLYNTSISLIKGLLNVVIALIISVYMIADRENLIRNWNRMIYSIIPTKGSIFFLRASTESASIFSKYVVGKTIDSLIIGLITFILTSIFQLDYTLLISILVGVTNMIPYFGPFIGGAIGVVILLIESPLDALIFAIMILVIQQFDGLFLGPKILGESTGLKPLWVIFGITVGGSLFGVMGMLIGVPCVAVISFLLNTYIEYRMKNRDIVYKDGKVYSIDNKKKKSTPNT